ncbi:MAG: tetratricopeptide repeat protein [Methanobacteriota archaeon]
MTHDPARLAKELRELSEPEFRSFVERVLKGMGLETKGFRTSGDSMEMEAHLIANGDKYLVFATRGLDSARPHDIQKSVERMRKAGVPRGIYITAGDVSKDAENYAAQFDVAVADTERFGQLLDKFGLTEELDRRSTESFLEKDGNRQLPSMGQLDSIMKWGYDFYEAGNYRKAIEYFDKAAALKPDYDVPHAMLGNCQAALGQNDKAVEAYEEALRRNPGSDEGWFNLGAVLYSKGKHDDELACYDKALELNKTYEKALNNKGATLLELGKDEEAVLCFDQALRSNPKNERALSNRGVALKHLGRSDEALASFNKALELRGDNLDTWLNRGLLLQDLGRHLEAVKSYDRVLEKFKTPEMHAQKASALVAAGVYKAALDSLELALDMKPGWDVAIELREKTERALRQEQEERLRQQREAKERQQQAERSVPVKPVEVPVQAPLPVPEPAPFEAVSMTEPVPSVSEVPPAGIAPGSGESESEDTVLFTCSECGGDVGERDNFCMGCGSDLRETEEPELEPDLPAGEPEEIERIEDARAEEREVLEFDELVGLGELCMRLGMFEDAIGRFGEAMLLRSESRLPRMQGEAAYALGHYEEAASFFEDALDLDPDDTAAALGRTEALLGSSRYAAASEALSAITAKTDISVPLLLLKADLLDFWGRKGKASEALEEAAELAKSSADLWNKVGNTLYLSGKLDDALMCLDKALQSDPGHWEAWCDRGAVFASRGELDQAIKSYDRALDARPDALAALAGKASVLARQGRAGESLELIGDGLAAVKSPELYAIKSFVMLESDDLKGAVRAADDGLKLDERSAELWNIRGIALKRAGKTADAIASFEEALSLAPDFSDAMKNIEGVEREVVPEKDASKPARKQAQEQPPERKTPAPAAARKERKRSGVACQECGETNDIGAKKCHACGERLRYKDKEDALAREMESAISGDGGAAKKKGTKKVAKRDRESFVQKLMSVPGIGYSKANDLWEAGFCSEDDIHRAEMAELTRIQGISPGLARKLKKGI